MKVSVVSRSGREVVRGGIDLPDSVRVPLPATLCSPRRGFASATWVGEGFKISPASNAPFELRFDALHLALR